MLIGKHMPTATHTTIVTLSLSLAHSSFFAACIRRHYFHPGDHTFPWRLFPQLGLWYLYFEICWPSILIFDILGTNYKHQDTPNEMANKLRKSVNHKVDKCYHQSLQVDRSNIFDRSDQRKVNFEGCNWIASFYFPRDYCCLCLLRFIERFQIFWNWQK